MIDDKVYYTAARGSWWSGNAPANSGAPFDAPFYIIFNLAIGGNWAGNTVAQGPHVMLVDWVRVWDVSLFSRPSPPFPPPRPLSPSTTHSSPPSPLPPSPPAAPNGPGRRLRWSDEFTPGSSINQVMSGYSTGTGCSIRHWAASDHQSIFTYFNLPVPVL